MYSVRVDYCYIMELHIISELQNAQGKIGGFPFSHAKRTKQAFNENTCIQSFAVLVDYDNEQFCYRSRIRRV